MKAAIKVFLVEDSPIALNILQRVLTSSLDIEVVGTATNGISALKQIPVVKPDVVCTDILMGKMDGLELTKKLMAEFPLPILVISDVVTENHTEKIGELLEAGAVDVFPKPRTGFIEDYQKQQQDLICKLKILAGVRVFTKRNYSFNSAIEKPLYESDFKTKPVAIEGKSDRKYQIIAIGVSTGGPKAIQEITKNLPANFPIPIVCTQHISIGFLDSLISWLSSSIKLKVKVAEINETPRSGTFYFAPEKYHLEIDSSGNFCYSQSSPINNHRPSATIMMHSVAKFYGSSAIGILLTGMGKDGVLGMQEIYRCGGLTIAQDAASSVIFGMPQEAIKLGIVRQVLPLKKIAPFLLERVQNK